MAKNRTRRELADEAWLKSQQIDIEGQLEARPSVFEPPQHRDVPAACPACAAPMRLGSGWTALSGTSAGIGVLQCGQCGHSISVPTPVFDQFKADVHAFFAARAAARAPLPSTKHGKKERGAG